MTERVELKQADTMVVQLAAPFVLPSLHSTAERMLLEAIEFCANKMGIGSRAMAIELLVQQDRIACQYCLYSMAKQVAASLGAMDEHVRAVYLLDDDPTPEDLFCPRFPSSPLIHLVVWTERKTAALDSLAQALDRALAQALADTIDVRGRTTLLDVQIVDDTDVEQRRGYGAFSTWMHRPALEIWKR